MFHNRSDETQIHYNTTLLPRDKIGAQAKIKIKWMTVSLGSSLASGGICLFVDLWEAQPCLGDPE